MTHEFQSIDARITALLRDRHGKGLGNGDIARHFNMLPTQCITVIKRLERAGVVRADWSKKRALYFVPTAEQQASHEAAGNALPPVRPFKPYVMPQAMRDLDDRIRRERDDHASFFGNAIPTGAGQ